MSIAREVEVLSEEMKRYNSKADQKVQLAINKIVEEETARQNKELTEIKDSIKSEDSEVRRIMRRNEEINQQLRTTEQEGKTRLVSKVSENARLKEELANLEQQHSKLSLQLNSEKKEEDKRRTDFVILEKELKDLKESTNGLEDKYEREVEQLKDKHYQLIQELKADEEYYLSEQQRLEELIKSEKDEIKELNKRHKHLIADIETKMSATMHRHLVNEAAENKQVDRSPK